MGVFSGMDTWVFIHVMMTGRVKFASVPVFSQFWHTGGKNWKILLMMDCFTTAASWHSWDSKAVGIWFQILLKLLFPQAVVIMSEIHCEGRCCHHTFIFVYWAGSLSWPTLMKEGQTRMSHRWLSEFSPNHLWCWEFVLSRVLVMPRCGFKLCMCHSHKVWTPWSLWVPSSSEYSIILNSVILTAVDEIRMSGKNCEGRCIVPQALVWSGSGSFYSTRCVNVYLKTSYT